MPSVCFVTLSRSDYASLRPVALAALADPAIDLRPVAGGSHALARYGDTLRQIEAEYDQELDAVEEELEQLRAERDQARRELVAARRARDTARNAIDLARREGEGAFQEIDASRRALEEPGGGREGQ